MSKNLEEARQAYQRAVKNRRKAEAEQVLGQELAALPGSVRPQVRRLVEAQTRRFTEQIDVPSIDLPADVQELPEEAQMLWTSTYMEKLGAGAEAEAAAHEAWSVVYSKWAKDPESGEWMKKAAEEPPAEEPPLPPMEEPFTMEAYRNLVHETVQGIRQALAEAAGSGVEGVGSPPGGQQQTEEQIREARIKNYEDAGYSHEEAVAAVDG